MKLTRVIRDVVFIAFVFSGLQILNTLLLKDALLQQDRLAARRLGASVTGILNKAHKAKDDIAIYEVTSALSKAQGIAQSYVADPQTKIIAQPGLYSFGLTDGSERWGTLVLLMSDRFTKKLIHRQAYAGIATAGIVCLGLFIYLQFLEKKKFKLEGRLEEVDGLLQIEKRKRSASEEREEKASLQGRTCLQRAVQRISDPLIILDSQLRITALNRSALAWLEVSEAENCLLKSWHEVSILGSCGVAIERSLASPGQDIASPTPDKNFEFLFHTAADGLSGTWVGIKASHNG